MSEHMATGCAAWVLLLLYTIVAFGAGYLVAVLL